MACGDIMLKSIHGFLNKFIDSKLKHETVIQFFGIVESYEVAKSKVEIVQKVATSAY